jgi:hypothetical protein
MKKKNDRKRKERSCVREREGVLIEKAVGIERR